MPSQRTCDRPSHSAQGAVIVAHREQYTVVQISVVSDAFRWMRLQHGTRIAVRVHHALEE